ncbi:unnamed protein product [Adineta ricciae]|uniref:F-box domain-containing protein n=1 Tax=Adineta ricciae TaxID=249248 RepID=A0A815TET3_ADIRI|nr:unnamed protein product [Adineta ricciae]CAF1501080.1 unnamed protein product [Adineta ricciae]
MDRLPVELLKRIFLFIDQLSDLIRTSLVCQQWRSLIVDDEHFLNKWFHLSLKFSQQSPRSHLTTNDGDRRQGLILNPDRSLFLPNLQSSECYLLQLMDLFDPDDNEYFFEQQYPSLLFNGSHSFSLWFFLPHQGELAIQIGTASILDLHHCSHDGHDGHRWRTGNSGKIIMDDRWIHIVIGISESQSFYRIWLNGQDFKTFNLHYTYNKHTNRICSTSAITLTCKRFERSIQSPIYARIADLVAFKRCLSTIEIRAIYEQQKCISQVQVGTFMRNERERKQNSISS